MKRNYTKAVLTSALASVMLATGLLASAKSDWVPVKGGQFQAAPTVEQKVKKTEFQKYRESVGAYGNPDAQIKPIHDGARPTPRLKQKPGNIARSPQAPRGTMYGVVNRHASMVMNSDAYLGKIDMATGNMSRVFYSQFLCPYIGDDYTLQTNAYRKGQLICPAADGAEDANPWHVINFETGDIEDTITFPNEPYSNVYTMTYDPDKDLIYALSINNAVGKDGNFVIIDPNNGNETFRWGLNFVGNVRDKLGYVAAIAYNCTDKQIYIFNWNNEVYVLNPDAFEFEKTGWRLVGQVDSDIDFFNQEGVTSQVVWSPADEMFIVIYRDDMAQACRLMYVDPETFEVYPGQLIDPANSPYIAALICLDENADVNAPELAPEPSFAFNKAELSGTVSFTAPTYTFVGVSLEGSNFKTVVTVDGNVIYEGNPTPGQKIDVPLTLAEGLHTLEVISYVGELESPKRTVDFYVGNDSPKAPTNIKISGDAISWKAPGAIGEHEGYVDVTKITYDVFMNGVKQNAEPITDTSFTLTAPESMQDYEFSVVASASGHSSQGGLLKEVYGKAFNLPVFHKPTEEESKLYRRINYNNDGRVWFWTDESSKVDAISGENHYGFAMVTGYTDDADDWLIFPKMNFPAKEYLYTFDFDIAGVFSIETIESYEIYLGKEPTVESMRKGLNIYSDNYYRATTDWEHKTISFAVQDPGDYYLAIRINSSKNTDPSGQGLFFNDFDIKVAEGKSTAVPADPTKVVIEPNENGDNEFYAVVTLPTLDITGAELPKDKEISVRVSYDGQENIGSGLPGETIRIFKSVKDNGFANILITPFNENGEGYPRTYRAYIGIDRPLCPTDIAGTMSEDNCTMHLTWTAPGSVGANGGHVNVEDLKYNIYTQSGVTNSKIGETTALEYYFSPFTGDVKTLATYYVGPSAESEGGESANSLFLKEDIGIPYEIPMKEEWGAQKFDYSPYTFDQSGAFASSFFSNTSSAAGLGIGDPIVINGAILGYSQAGPCEGRLLLPKASTKGIKKVIFRTRVWDYAETVKTLELYGRRYGNEKETLLGTITMQRPNKGEWADAELALPADYCDCPWIQLRLGTHFTGAGNEYIVLDNFEIIPDADVDMAVTSVKGLTQVSVGDNAEYEVIVANAGRERTNGTLNVEFKDAEGKVVASRQTAVSSLNTNQTFEYLAEFEITGLFRDLGNLTLSAYVETAGDENLVNNTRTLPVEVMGSQLPVVTDLAADVKDSGVELTWSQPAAEYGNFENFETRKPFQITDQIGYFGNVDLDGLYPIALGDETSGTMLTWDNFEEKQAWTVLDMEQLGMLKDSRIAPHSGKNVLIARTGYYDEDSEPIQSSKWLVSPEIEKESSMSFWFTTPSASYTEYIELWTSETDTHFDEANKTAQRNGAWRKKASFSKSGAETWEFVKWNQFTSRDKYFALRFCSFDGVAMVIDDISFTPKQMLNHDITHYEVYREDMEGNVVKVADNLTTTSFTDTDTSDPNVKYYVLTYVNYDNENIAGPKSNIVYLGISTVNGIAAAQKISAANGAIRIDGLEGENFVISNADGMVVAKGTVNSNQAYYNVDKGVYIVKAGKLTSKLIIK